MPFRKSHEPQSISEELLEHTSHLRAFAISLCGDKDYGDDLVQETLTKAIANIDSFKPGTNMRSWLFTILRNTYFTQLRRARHEVRDADGAMAASLSSQPPQEPHLDFQDFERALALLNEEQREALILIGAAGFSYDEAAEIAGCSSGTVKSRVNRARTKLSQMLSAEPQQSPLKPTESAARPAASDSLTPGLG
jgi:RNA polymerase sigma-70 factor (ECF subfamily)